MNAVPSRYHKPRETAMQSSLAMPPRSHLAATNSPVVNLPPKGTRVPVLLPTQPVLKQVPETALVGDLIDVLVADHRYEMGGSDDVVLWEVAKGLRRPTRRSESVQAIMATWRHDNSSYFFQTSLGDIRSDPDSLAALVPRRDIVKKPPQMRNLMVHYAVPRTKSTSVSQWSRGTLDVYEGNIVLSERSQTTYALKFSKTFALSTVDAYEPTSQRGPARYTVVIRSQLPSGHFIDVSDTVLFISLDSVAEYSLLRNILFTLRTTAIESRNQAHTITGVRKDSPVSGSSANLTARDDLSPPPTLGSSRSSNSSLRSNSPRYHSPSPQPTGQTPLKTPQYGSQHGNPFKNGQPTQSVPPTGQRLVQRSFDVDPRIAPGGLIGNSYGARLEQAKQSRVNRHISETRAASPVGMGPSIAANSIVGSMQPQGERLRTTGLIGRVRSTPKR